MNICELNPYAVTVNGEEGIKVKTLVCTKTARFLLTNTGESPVRIKEVVLLDGLHLSPDTKFYAEAYNMLAQYRGTVSEPTCIGEYPDKSHYKLVGGGDNFFTAYNYAVFGTGRNCVLFGFTSCNRFSGQIRFNTSGRLQLALDMEGITVEAGQSIPLEEVMISSGGKRADLLDEFISRTAINHPMLNFPEVPTGWCSWYCFGHNVTEKNILDNLYGIKKKGMPLRYIQIDDGYQSAMGDWLITNPEFDHNISETLTVITREGFEPAIWVAPFIAEKNSKLFTQHPEWFVMDENGEPLASDTVSFGGWAAPPWYMLDPTVPGAYEYIRTVFSTMRRRWHVKYFKLDANMWGALPFGVRHDKNKTAVEAYRLGMKAVLEGAGADSFILGCNAPMWPSLGLVHGMRTTGDISREWKVFRRLKDECLSRNAYNGKLWINDPDCVTLANLREDLIAGNGEHTVKETCITQEEFLFHATYILASGGMILSGDDLADEPENLDVFNRLLNQKRVSAQFDEALEIGKIVERNSTRYFLLNDSDEEKTYELDAERYGYVTELWTGEHLRVNENNTVSVTVPAHGGRVAVMMKTD